MSLEKYLVEKYLVEKKEEFQEGDKVEITYGEYNHRIGVFIEYSVSGDFAIIKINKKNIVIDASDIKGVNNE